MHYSSMRDELEKIAFGLEDARKMLRASKKMNFRVGNRQGIGYGTIGSKKFQRGQLKGVEKELVGRGVDPETANQAVKAVKAQQVQAMEGAMDNPEDWARTKTFTTSPEKGDFKRWATERGIPGTDKIKTPEQRMMSEALMKGHEMAEVAASKAPKKAFSGVGHLSPEVIMKEHNMLRTMPEDVRKGLDPVMQTIRGVDGQGEAVALKQYGIDYGKSPRLSRHARKRITEMMEKDVSPQFSAAYDGLAEAAPSLAAGLR